MARRVKTMLRGLVIIFMLMVGVTSGYAQTTNSCTAAIKSKAVTDCAVKCGNDGQCIFGCEVGQDFTVDRCYSDCNGFSSTCLNSCLAVINTINAACETMSIGGSASGLDAGKSVVLQNNAGDNLTVNSNGGFTFPTKIFGGLSYAVTVLTQPPGQTCVVGNGSGTANANVSDVTLSCMDHAVTGNTTGGEVTAAITGGSCAGYQPGSTSFTGPVNPPAGITFPYGVFAFTASNCNTNGSVTVTLTYPNDLPPGTRYLKYINGSWVDWTSLVTMSGHTVVLTLTDGGNGDTNPAPGVISDPGGPAVPPAAVPTLPQWAIVLLATALATVVACVAVARRRQR